MIQCESEPGQVWLTFACVIADGTRGDQLYQLTGIPLTPGPLVVVVKVAASQVNNASGEQSQA